MAYYGIINSRDMAINDPNYIILHRRSNCTMAITFVSFTYACEYLGCPGHYNHIRVRHYVTIFGSLSFRIRVITLPYLGHYPSIFGSVSFHIRVIIRFYEGHSLYYHIWVTVLVIMLSYKSQYPNVLGRYSCLRLRVSWLFRF